MSCIEQHLVTTRDFLTYKVLFLKYHSKMMSYKTQDWEKAKLTLAELTHKVNRSHLTLKINTNIRKASYFCFCETSEEKWQIVTSYSKCWMSAEYYYHDI